ncbi:MAG TPA: APC family permease [Ktedonobacteraceae bacterium]|nr:APC family permease [Ktedonobacteraceae bacterium]
MTIEATPPTEQQTTLRSNAIGLPGVLFQSVTTMAPAGAVAFSLGAAIPFTGGALPLAVLIALIACALVALNIGSMAKHLPSAGGYFTYVTRGLGPQVGWLAGWLFTFTYILFLPLTLLVLGAVGDSFMSSTFHVSLGTNGWIVYALIFAVIAFALTYFGIKISADVGVVLGLIEIVVFGVLSIFLIVHAGSGNTAATFNPASSQQPGLGGWQGVLFGMLFAFLAFSGFESSAILGEESHNPRRIVPRAILLATVLIGVFYVFCSYAGVVGWGFSKITAYPNDSNPWGTMAALVWGPVAFIAILAILNSALGNANAAINAGARMLFAMGRIKALPGALGRTNRYRVPGPAIILMLILGIAITLWVGLVYGPTLAFAFIGAILTVPILLVYMATCLSVPFFYWREHRDEFNVARHVILPAIPFILLGVVIYFQFVPLPAAPFNQVGPIDAAWLVLGIIVVILLSLRAPQVLRQGTTLFAEEPDGKETA